MQPSHSGGCDPLFHRRCRHGQGTAILPDDLFLETIAQLPMLDLTENLNEMARTIVYRELCMKFGFVTDDLSKFCRTFLQYNPGHLLVMFLDLTMQHVSAAYKDCKDPEILQLNTELNLDKAEEIEEYLKLVERADGMEEINGRMNIDEFIASEESEPECPMKV